MTPAPLASVTEVTELARQPMPAAAEERIELPGLGSVSLRAVRWLSGLVAFCTFFIVEHSLTNSLRSET